MEITITKTKIQLQPGEITMTKTKMWGISRSNRLLLVIKLQLKLKCGLNNGNYYN